VSQQTGISTIQQGGQHLLALINDVLDLARVDAGRMEFHPRPARLGELLSVVGDIMRVRAEQKHLCFELELMEGLPVAVSVDETRLRQVLLNLLGNAVKFTDRGAVRLRVTSLPPAAGQAADATLLRFEVTDEGIGIAAGQQEAIFRPFEQVGDASRRAGGTGLGLAISRQLVGLMGGVLQVESAPGKGSRFWFDVPLPVVAAPDAQMGGERIATGYLGPRKTILVVDDVAANRALLRDLLGSLGFRTFEAENGMSALVQTQTMRPDMVLLDMVMPGMDGIETTRRLRSDERTVNTPVLMISASSTPEQEERSLEVGANAFLPKPVNEHDLLREIGAHLKLEWTE